MREWPELMLMFSLSLGAVFIALGLCIFLPDYATEVVSNEGFLNGTCIYKPGIVEQTTCGGSIWKTDCWFADIGLSAVYNVTGYLTFGPFGNLREANKMINYTVGSIFGPCYYKDGGTTIVTSLQNTQKDLVALVLLLVVGFLLLILSFGFYCILIRNLRKRLAYTRVNDIRPGMIV